MHCSCFFSKHTTKHFHCETHQTSFSFCCSWVRSNCEVHPDYISDSKLALFYFPCHWQNASVGVFQTARSSSSTEARRCPGPVPAITAYEALDVEAARVEVRPAPGVPSARSADPTVALHYTVRATANLSGATVALDNGTFYPGSLRWSRSSVASAATPCVGRSIVIHQTWCTWGGGGLKSGANRFYQPPPHFPRGPLQPRPNPCQLDGPYTTTPQDFWLFFTPNPATVGYWGGRVTFGAAGLYPWTYHYPPVVVFGVLNVAGPAATRVGPAQMAVLQMVLAGGPADRA